MYPGARCSPMIFWYIRDLKCPEYLRLRLDNDIGNGAVKNNMSNINEGADSNPLSVDRVVQSILHYMHI